MPTFGCTGGGQTYATEVRVCQAVSNPPPIIQYYDGQGGGQLANVPPAGTFPTATELATNGLSMSVANFGNRADNYSARLRGFLAPTTTGAYTFYLSSDDAGQFSLGAAGAALGATLPIATNAGYSGPPGSGGSTSAVVNLVAGQFYPFEVIFSEGGGGDYALVEWSRASPAIGRSAIPASMVVSGTTAGLRAVYRTTTVTAGVPVITYALIDGTPVLPTAASPIVDCP